MMNHELHFASQNGHAGRVAELLQQGADVNAKDDSNRTPLHRAAANGRKDIVELLLQGGADIKAKDNSGRTALLEAAENNHDEIARQLLDKGVDVNIEDNSKQTALHRAAKNGHETVVSLLLQRGANINAEDEAKERALHVGAKKGREVVVDLLLSQMADVAAKDDSEQTALHKAAENGHVAVIELLLARGANIGGEDDSKQTALHLAAKNGHEKIVKLLAEKHAELDPEDDARHTPLSLAVVNRHVGVVKCLLENGAKVRVRGIRFKETQNWWVQMAGGAVVQPLRGDDVDIDATGMNLGMALRWAAASGYEVGVGLLLDRGADVNASGRDGRTALHWAAEKGHATVIELLLDEAADINAKDDSGKTALHWAAMGGHQEVVSVLLKRRADIEARDNDGRVALHRATDNKHVGVVQFLLDNKANANARVTTPKTAESIVDSSDIIPDQYIVTLQPNVSEAQAEAHINSIRDHINNMERESKEVSSGGASSKEASSTTIPNPRNTYRIKHRFHIIRGYSGTFDEGTAVKIKNSWEVDKIEPNAHGRLTRAQIQEDVPSWGLARICRNHPVNASATHDMTYTYSHMNKVQAFAYVIDTGVDDHDEFKGRLLQGYNASANTSDTNDTDGHGTHVAGTIAGSLCGVAKQAHIIPVKVSDDYPPGTDRRQRILRLDDVIAGLEWSINNAISSGRIYQSVANISLVFSKNDQLNDYIATAVKWGLTVVVAAGNCATNASETSPASAPEAIVVGATAIEDTIASYSNYGRCLDILAPGTDITSARAGGGFAVMSGTSMACPHVTGVACCLIHSLQPYSPMIIIQYLKKMAGINQIAGLQDETPNLMLSAL